MNKIKCAVIVGITSQDGSYLSELLIDKGYYVVGVKRRTSTSNLWRLKNVLNNNNFVLVDGDVTDPYSMGDILKKYYPDEVYNLAAMSFVGESFSSPTATFDINTKGCLNILEYIRHNSRASTKYYFAATSEMFGKSIDLDGYQRETTPFLPRSPYAISKCAAFQLTKMYREAYGIFACNGILFNHSSPRRGDEFFIKKVTNYVSYIRQQRLLGFTLKECKKLKLGNLSFSRDEGHSKDYVEAMWAMLQHSHPDDYVVATGETHSGEDYLNTAFTYIGVDWHGLIEVDESLIRPADVIMLRGDYSKIKNTLGWQPKTTFLNLIIEMVNKACIQF